MLTGWNHRGSPPTRSEGKGQPEHIEGVDRIARRVRPTMGPTRLDVGAQRATARAVSALPHLDDYAEPWLRHELRPGLKPRR